jgi:hypothetical protein
MKIVFLIALLLGFGATLAGAHMAPGLRHARLPSQTSVVANGGRAEEFLIRLPADRIAATDGEAGGVRAAGADGVMLLPAQLLAEPLLVEHFKVRDSAGAVIGVAARHWNGTGGEATTTWSILIPSRGALVLSARGEDRAQLDSALRSRGYSAGTSWAGTVTLAMTGDGHGVVAAGAGEFENLLGTYTETWSVAAVDESGKVSGTIALSTVTSRLQ